MKPAALIVGITVALVAGIALIVAGITIGGWWRWAGGVATVAGIAVIATPNIKHRNTKEENRNEQ